MRLAIDLMGGDHGPEHLLPAVVRALEEYPRLTLILVGERSVIETFVRNHGSIAQRVTLCPTVSVVEMADGAATALRRKQDSSMFGAVRLVADGDADAAVSTGNTGAFMAIGRHLLKTVEGIDRPAIIKAIPSTKGKCYLLDLGANINSDAENLVQFAVMGSLMCGAVESIAEPTVGLLNIGEEEMKGEARVKAAADTLRSFPGINYIGFVEGDGIYQSDADVLVCDGWVGNVALKTSEGLARFVSYMIERAFSQNVATMAAAVISDPVLRQLREQLKPDNYNGATLLGLAGVLVKSHGSSSADGFFHAIKEAVRSVEQDIPGLLRARLPALLAAHE